MAEIQRRRFPLTHRLNEQGETQMKRPFETEAILGAILAYFIAADRVTASTIAAVEAMPVGATAVD